MHNLGTFELELENNFVIFEISSLEFVLLENFEEKQKSLNLESKMPYLGYFWPRMHYFGIFGLDVQKSYRHIWNQHPQICLFEKFHKKAKMSKFGTKMPDLSVFGLAFENNIVIFEITSLKFV